MKTIDMRYNDAHLLLKQHSGYTSLQIFTYDGDVTVHDINEFIAVLMKMRDDLAVAEER